jgi:hypothetical protein
MLDRLDAGLHSGWSAADEDRYQDALLANRKQVRAIEDESWDAALAAVEALTKEHVPEVDGYWESGIYQGCSCGRTADEQARGSCPDFLAAIASLRKPGQPPATEGR